MTTLNPSPTDAELLAAYASTKSEDAFRRLIERYVNLVHAAAYRKVGAAADDVTQAVFLALSQRAHALQEYPVIAGWLVVTTRNIANGYIKQETRIKSRESKAAAMAPATSPDASQPVLTEEARRILPALDDAIARLGEVDRNVILLRYFSARGTREIGQTLGLSERAAAKRVTRAIVKLRKILAGQGFTASEAALSAALPALMVHSAPAGLVTAIQSSVGGATPAITSLAKMSGGLSTSGLAVGASIAAVVVLAGGAWLATSLLQTSPTKTPAAPAPQAAVATQPAAPSNMSTVTLVLTDPATKQSVTDAQVQVWDDTMGGNSRNAALIPVEANGTYTVRVPKDYKYLQVNAHAPGRVPMTLTVNNQALRGDVQPTLTIPMETGRAIGGKVTDTIGDSVVGARVELYVSNGEEERARPSLSDETIFTDADGKWEYPTAPSSLDGVYLQIRHGDFAEPDGSIALSDLVKQSGITVLKKAEEGRIVEGIVYDPDGKPLEGAKVVAATDRFESKKPTTKTDKDGRFKLTGLGEWTNVVTITTTQFAVEQAKIEQGAKRSKVEVKLNKPVVFEGTVVNSDGTPAAKVQLQAERWRNNRALDWTTKTDANGHFVWKNAPADEFQINVYGKNTGSIQDKVVQAGKGPVKLTLYPPLQISGKVIDAGSKEPVKEFRMVYGIRWTGQQDVTWQSQSARTIANGKYDATITDFSNGGKLRVEATGYLPAESRLINSDEGKLTIDFELKKGTGPAGFVVDSDGKPIGDLKVYCVTAQQGFYFNPDESGSNGLDDRGDVGRSVTDVEGRYAFNPQDQKFALVILSPQGFLSVQGDTLPSDGKLVLPKWARIEGTYRLNGAPANAVKMRVALHGEGSSPTSIDYSRTATTDADGHFVFEQAPVGAVSLMEAVPLSARSTRYRNLGQYKTESGQTLKLALGGNGRAITFKVLRPDGTAPPAENGRWLSVSLAHPDGSAKMAEAISKMGIPDEFPDWTLAQRQAWHDEKMKDPAFVASLTSVQAPPASAKPIDFILFPDGTVTADNVEPGTYDVQVSMMLQHKVGEQTRAETAATTTVTLTIPKASAGDATAPLKLPDVRLKEPYGKKAGEPLPPIRLVTLDGKPVDASILATGKPTIVHVWSFDERNGIPTLKALDAKYAGKLNLVNVGRRMPPKWVKRLAEKDALPGVVAMIETDYQLKWNDSRLDSQLGMMLPTCYVLDGGGKLIQQVVEMSELEKVVDGVMSLPAK